ncbi:MAG TPA: di-heme oxidoredictase family protein [Casimicrobiaceae bacterium]|nr:di-heme oxidoredictase family protein [Casimicrobiaceae bacterium]
MKRSRLFLALAAVAVVALADVEAQSTFNATAGSQQTRRPRHRTRPPPVVVPKSTADFGDPIPGLTASQLADFAEGEDDFEEEDTAESGLGPIFNNVSCVACHSVPATGGSSAITVTRFGHTANGVFDPMDSQGGSLLQQNAIDPAVQEVVPPTANVTAKRLTTPLFGAGLIEAIPDAQILANAGPQGNGISGRVSVVSDVASGHTRVGRFGWKAQQATLLSFAGDAYVNEIGVTSRLFPKENAPDGNVALLAQYDLVADPEDQVDPATGKADIDHFADFMRLLAPPKPIALTPRARAGRQLFSDVGCDGCHISTMTTGPSPIAMLDHKLVPLFSDLLLHDMGSLGDGIGQGTAGPSEMKTAPLWGLRVRVAFLHDGRAATPDAAIRMHDGEAARVRDRYQRLTANEQQALLEFLRSI